MDLHELLFDALERRADGDSGAIDALAAQYPEHAEALRAHLRTLESAGLVEQEGAADDAIPERLGDFRLRRRIGQGGMGVVYLADDPTLGRSVALKVLRPEQVFFQGARERFRREALSVARLAHPGIVPLYTAGEAAGLPYFTMELVEGASLAETLRELEGRDPSQLSGADLLQAVRAVAERRGFGAIPGRPEEPLFSGDWLRAVLWLVREVAQALEHAHQRGVLHRDLKPSNVLLTADGRVLLVDFGLASLQSVDRLTRSGALLGSLPYMSPEQVSGDAAKIDGRSDVYGLGVLLYELLTLRMPFGESDPTKLSLRIARGDAPSPRQFHRALTSDVVTVCQTAMEVDRARRYASPADLARDLSNLLEHRPIQARASGLGLLLVRWAQRRPAHAVAVAAIGLSLVAGPLTLAQLERRNSARVAAERDVASRNLDAALEAVEVLLERVGHSELREIPGLERLRAALLTRATDLYGRLEATAPGELRTRLRIAAAKGRLARLRSESGDRAGALADFDAAEARFVALYAEAPDNPAVLFDYGNLLAFATVTRYPADPVKAVAALQYAVELLRRARALSPLEPRPRMELARALLGLAHFEDAQRHQTVALEAYHEVEVLTAELLAELPPDSPLWIDAVELEGTALGRRGNVHWRVGEREEAVRLFRRVLARCAELPKLSAFMRHLRAATVQTMALAQRGEAETPEARRELDELMALAYSDASTLAREFPSNQRYLASLVQSHLGLGRRARARGDAGRAETEAGAALRACQDLVARFPEDPSHLRTLAVTQQVLADLVGDTGEHVAERAACIAVCEAFAFAQARGAQIEPGDILAPARRGMELALEHSDLESLIRIATQLEAWLPARFAATMDSARGRMLAVALAQELGAEDEVQGLADAAAEALARALVLRPEARDLVMELARELGLDKHFALERQD